MGKLLLNEQPLFVLPSLAEAIGLNESIFLQQLHYWLQTSKHFFDGKPWIYNTYEDFQKQFPWCGIKTVQRTFDKLRELGLIIVGNFNKKRNDKTNWYTIDYEKLNQLEESLSSQNDQSICPDGSSQNDQMDLVKMTNQIGQNDQSITIIDPQILPIYKNTYTPEFEIFWKEYPKTKHQSKINTFRCWKTRLKEGHTPEAIIAGAKNYAIWCKKERREEQYIKAPETFLGPGLHFLSFQKIETQNKSDPAEEQIQKLIEAGRVST